MIMFLFGMGFGMIFGAVLCGIGTADHSQEDYMRGFRDRGEMEDKDNEN